MTTSHLLYLHHHPKSPLIKENNKMHIFHLKLDLDDGVLVYDENCVRSGPPIYGLTVLQPMGMPKMRTKGCSEILNYLQNKNMKI